MDTKFIIIKKLLGGQEMVLTGHTEDSKPIFEDFNVYFNKAQHFSMMSMAEREIMDYSDYYNEEAEIAIFEVKRIFVQPVFMDRAEYDKK